jgi:hypothetical protein
MAHGWLDILDRTEGADLGAAVVRLARLAAAAHRFQQAEAGAATSIDAPALVEDEATDPTGPMHPTETVGLYGAEVSR